MIRVLHAARVEADNGKDLDMEILLNLNGGIFKPKDEDHTTAIQFIDAQLERINSQAVFG